MKTKTTAKAPPPCSVSLRSFFEHTASPPSMHTHPFACLNMKDGSSRNLRSNFSSHIYAL